MGWKEIGLPLLGLPELPLDSGCLREAEGSCSVAAARAQPGSTKDCWLQPLPRAPKTVPQGGWRGCTWPPGTFCGSQNMQRT